MQVKMKRVIHEAGSWLRNTESPVEFRDIWEIPYALPLSTFPSDLQGPLLILLSNTISYSDHCSIELCWVIYSNCEGYMAPHTHLKALTKMAATLLLAWQMRWYFQTHIYPEVQGLRRIGNEACFWTGIICTSQILWLLPFRRNSIQRV